MNILVVCPAKVATGGTEALHEFASNMNKLDGVNARLWYWNSSSDQEPMPEEFRRYHCRFTMKLPEDYDGVIVFPEIYANYAMNFKHLVRAIWWLGIDAYANWTPEADQGKFLEDESIIHIAQSQYAYNFLWALGVRNLHRCGDMLNADFYADYGEEERSDVVLYNPTKATPFMRRIIDACPDITFKPIRGMTRAEVIDTMRHSKLYVDFGEFPGRERMPREACLCGCCLITSKVGAAAYAADFGHDYKYDMKDAHIWAITRKIREVLGNFDRCRRDFAAFRFQLYEERKLIRREYEDIAGVFDEVLSNHSRA